MLSLSSKLYYLYRMNKNFTLNEKCFVKIQGGYTPPNFTQGGVMDCPPPLETPYDVCLFYEIFCPNNFSRAFQVFAYLNNENIWKRANPAFSQGLELIKPDSSRRKQHISISFSDQE